MSQIFLSLAPIQGVTDYIFRNLYFKHFTGLTNAYTPFVRFQKGLEVKKSQVADLQPENNRQILVVPQILSNKPEEIIYFSEYVKQLGYTEINWNLGCPFPMVAKRKLGSGLLPFPDTVEHILEQIFSNIRISFSIKTRLGYLNKEEIFPILKVFDKYPISQIIIHSRLGIQVYSGSVDLEKFGECIKSSRHKIVYNGDIANRNDFLKLQERFNSIDQWMIGRGVISNPFLPEEIMYENNDKTDYLQRLSEFHIDLYESYENLLSGPGHLLLKMEQLWYYFSFMFDNPHKVLKLIKKANSIEKYKSATQEIFNVYKLAERFVGQLG